MLYAFRGGALPPIFSTGMKRISLAILGRERTRRPGSPPAQGRAAEHGVGDTPIRTARARAQPTPVSRRPARDALPSEAAKTSSQPLEVSIPIVRRMLIFSSLFLWRPPRKAPAVQGPDALRGLQGGDPAEGRHPATPQPGRSSDRSVELTSARPGVRGLPYLYTRTVRPPACHLLGSSCGRSPVRAPLVVFGPMSACTRITRCTPSSLESK